MSEWHTTPNYIVNNWTDELLTLMIEKLSERKDRELRALKGKTSNNEVSSETLAARSHGMIEVKHGI